MTRSSTLPAETNRGSDAASAYRRRVPRDWLYLGRYCRRIESCFEEEGTPTLGLCHPCLPTVHRSTNLHLRPCIQCLIYRAEPFHFHTDSLHYLAFASHVVSRLTACQHRFNFFVICRALWVCLLQSHSYINYLRRAVPHFRFSSGDIMA